MAKNLSDIPDLLEESQNGPSGTIHLNALLHSLLEKTCRATHSCSGFRVALFSSLGSRVKTLSQLAPPSGTNTPRTFRQLEAWRSAPRRLPRELFECGHGMTRVCDNTASLDRVGAIGSSIALPWLDGERVIGVLMLDASRVESYDERHLRMYQASLNEAIAPVFRVILRQSCAASGISMDMVGESPAFLESERQLRIGAQAGDSSDLLTGERGTGKELAAMMVHFLSGRHRRPFVPVLCSAFTENLVADELFGHERHSFTGAAQTSREIQGCPGRYCLSR